MIELEHLWPDDERRDAALARIAERIGRTENPDLSPTQIRCLQASAFGLTDAMIAETFRLSIESVKTQLKRARYKLGAKNTTHACCEALRQGLIR